MKEPCRLRQEGGNMRKYLVSKTTPAFIDFLRLTGFTESPFELTIGRMSIDVVSCYEQCFESSC